MSMQDITRLNPKDIAEQIRRLDGKQFAELISVLCEDNMGSRLQTALSYENLDREFRKE